MRTPGLRALTAVLVMSALAVWSGVEQVVAAPAQESSSGPVASTNPPATAEVATLRERAAAFWAARVAGDAKGQWELLEPRGRGRLTPEEYAPGRGPVKYLAYQVEGATLNGYFATVQVRLLVQISPPTARPQRIDPSSHLVPDRWVRIGGVWYRSLEQEDSDTAAPQAGG